MALKEVVIDTKSKKLDSEQFSFEEKGDTLHGVIVEKVTLKSKPTPEHPQGKPFQKYTVRVPDGRLVSTLGSHKIDEFMLTRPLGTEIRITYLKKVKLDGLRTMKEFKFEDDIDESAPKQKTAAEVAAAARV
jgi:hypothetical protein